MLSCVQFFCDPVTVAYQAPLTVGFPRQEYWSGLPLPSPGLIQTQGSNLHLLHWQVDSLLLSHQGSPIMDTTKPLKKKQCNPAMGGGMDGFGGHYPK